MIRYRTADFRDLAILMRQAMDKASDMIEAKLSPWLRLILPILVALCLYILQSIDKKVELNAVLIQQMSKDHAEITERIRANETAIGIYHP